MELELFEMSSWFRDARLVFVDVSLCRGCYFEEPDQIVTIFVSVVAIDDVSVTSQ